MLDPEQLARYGTDGFVVVRAMLADDEVTSFRDRARVDLQREIDEGTSMRKSDRDGRRTLLKIWNSAGDDLYGRVARDQRLVSAAATILGPDIYVYSHKMTMKEPRHGGAWEWHQDFGYWYQNRCLAPEMLSVWIALDPSLESNGCLQVLAGSHELGRLDHVRVNEQTVVDNEYLDAARERCPHVFVEMQPGDALVFHCNLLHRSDANTSDMPRWGYIASYNTVRNQPFRHVRDYGEYQPLEPAKAGSFLAS